MIILTRGASEVVLVGGGECYFSFILFFMFVCMFLSVQSVGIIILMLIVGETKSGVGVVARSKLKEEFVRWKRAKLMPHQLSLLFLVNWLILTLPSSLKSTLTLL